MNRAWVGILIVFLGSLPVGRALQYYFADEPARNTSTSNWLVAGQAVFGIFIMGLGLYKQIKLSRKTPEPDDDSPIKLTDEK